MSVAVLEQKIKTALDAGSEAEQTTDNAVDTNAIRGQTASKIAAAVQDYVKSSLNTVIGGGVPVPQDGGTALKNTMQVQINTI